MAKEIPRIANQRTAAAMIGISTPRLRQMESDAPWWNPELRTNEGYDVCGIVRAQLTFSGKGTDDLELAKRGKLAEIERAEFQRQAEELKVWELERQKEEKLGNILPADIYAEFIRELLGMIRSSLVDLPLVVSQNCPPAHRSTVYVPQEKWKTERDASPLQKSIRKLLNDIDDWLKADPELETTN